MRIASFASARRLRRRALGAVCAVSLLIPFGACQKQNKNDGAQVLPNAEHETENTAEDNASVGENSAENGVPAQPAQDDAGDRQNGAPERPSQEHPGADDPAGGANSGTSSQNGEIALDAPLLTDDQVAELQKNIDALKDPEAQAAAFEPYIEKIARTEPNPEAALRFLYAFETMFGASERIDAIYQSALGLHPALNAKPRLIRPGRDISGMKRIGGGSTLVYKFYKDGKTVAAFKPLQSRFQSNYRSEIAAYRLCPAMKCGFDVPKNFHVYFDFKEFSGLYARNKANIPSEFKEIIPTKLPDNAYRVDGTYKEWIPDFADFPIELTALWQPWLNPGADRSALAAPATDILPDIAKKHPGGDAFAQKLRKHLEGVSKYELARQISNLLVFDFLINNWDRFSGAKNFFGVNCQIARGRFMSVDNGASFAQTPNPKPEKNLRRIRRFSRLTYDAVRAFDKEKLREFLFPDPTSFENEKFETFWQQRRRYLDYVQECIDENGAEETFFFE